MSGSADSLVPCDSSSSAAVQVDKALVHYNTGLVKEM